MPRLLLFVARPMIRFSPVNPQAFPVRWQETQYVLKITLFGVLPIGQQTVSISDTDRSSEKGQFHVELRDNGRGTVASTWDHLITIGASAGGCSYTDRVEVKAGVLTPFVLVFAWLFYWHRQRRLRLLARSGFSYGET